MDINEQEVIIGAPSVKCTGTWDSMHHYVHAYTFLHLKNLLQGSHILKNVAYIFKDSLL